VTATDTGRVGPAARFVSTHDHTCHAMGPGLIVVYTHSVDIALQSVIIDALDRVLTCATFHEIASPSVAESCMYVGPGLVPIHERDRAIWIELSEGFDAVESLAAVKRIVQPELPYTAMVVGGGTGEKAPEPRIFLRMLDALSPAKTEILWIALEQLSFVRAVGFNPNSHTFTINADARTLVDDVQMPDPITRALEEIGIYLVPSLPSPS
jgi:hypothetical protein